MIAESGVRRREAIGDAPAADRQRRRDDANFFDSLLDAVCGPDGLAVFLQAYFDESERESGDFCVAGFGFVPKQAKNFIRDWRKMLGSIKRFHTTDLVNRRGEFEGFSTDDVNRMLKRAIGIINLDYS